MVEAFKDRGKSKRVSVYETFSIHKVIYNWALDQNMWWESTISWVVLSMR